MAKLKGVPKSRSCNIYKSGMTRTEIFERTDKLRQELLNTLASRGATPVRTLAVILGVSYDSARTYGNYLVTIDAAVKYKDGLDTYYEATGNPYVQQSRKVGSKKPDADAVMPAVNPNLRVIRLLDRSPSDVSKYEHMANRRSSNMAVRGSSMAMFDSY